MSVGARLRRLLGALRTRLAGARLALAVERHRRAATGLDDAVREVLKH